MRRFDGNTYDAKIGRDQKVRDSTAEKLARLPSMTCRNCRYLTSLFFVKDFKKTDDGGVNYKYNYVWKINCLSQGKFEEIVEGTAHFCKVPGCSLWRPPT